MVRRHGDRPLARESVPAVHGTAAPVFRAAVPGLVPGYVDPVGLRPEQRDHLRAILGLRPGSGAPNRHAAMHRGMSVLQYERGGPVRHGHEAVAGWDDLVDAATPRPLRGTVCDRESRSQWQPNDGDARRCDRSRPSALSHLSHADDHGAGTRHRQGRDAAVLADHGHASDARHGPHDPQPEPALRCQPHAGQWSCEPGRHPILRGQGPGSWGRWILLGTSTRPHPVPRAP